MQEWKGAPVETRGDSLAGVWLARGCAAAFGRILTFRFPFGSYSGPPFTSLFNALSRAADRSWRIAVSVSYHLPNPYSVLCTLSSPRAARGAAPTFPSFSPFEKEWCSRWESNPNRRLRRPEFYPLKYESVLSFKQADCKGVKYFPKEATWRAFLHPTSLHLSHPLRGRARAPCAPAPPRYAGPCDPGRAR